MYLKSLFYRVVCVIILFCLTCCTGPTTFVFIDSVQQPTLIPSLPTDPPVPGIPTITPTLALPLDVVPNVEVVCSDGRLREVKVHLTVVGGVPPYTVYRGDHEESIDQPKPALSLQAGRYNEFTIGSSDGQAVPVKVYAPSSCDVRETNDSPDLHPITNPTAVRATQAVINPTEAQPTTKPHPDPTSEPTIAPTIPPVVVIDPPFKFQCSDGLDNDHDGKTDLDDPQCKNKADKDES